MFCPNIRKTRTFLLLEFSQQVQRHRVVDLVRRQPPEALARPAVYLIVHLPDLLVGYVREVGALGEILPDEPVGVLDRALLPGVVRRAEVEQRARLALHARPVGELLAAVGRHRAARLAGERLDLDVGDLGSAVRGRPRPGRSCGRPWTRGTVCLVKPRFRKRARLSFWFRRASFSVFGAGTPLAS